MSNPLDKLRGISQLPIFPLPLVMLPKEVLPLHIFEERYRQMLLDVEGRGNFFGVSLFESQGEFTDRPAVGTVGCVVEIKESELLDDGRSNIITLGLARYRIDEYLDDGRPYLAAEIEFFEDETAGEDELTWLADQVFVLFERMAKAAFKMSGGRGQLPELQRSDPESMSFLITAAFNFDNDKKYRLLETTSTYDRLAELKDVLDQAVDQVEQGAEIQLAAKTNGHSKKKLDL
jgi:Lon protease-like protein